jgi:uncharacterized protein (DUF4415 family)
VLSCNSWRNIRTVKRAKWSDTKTLWEIKGEAAVLEWFRADTQDTDAITTKVHECDAATAGE